MRIAKKKLTMARVTMLGLVCTFGLAGTLLAQDEESSECIACHTDLEAMDEYGAAAASSSAGIAG